MYELAEPFANLYLVVAPAIHAVQTAKHQSMRLSINPKNTSNHPLARYLIYWILMFFLLTTPNHCVFAILFIVLAARTIHFIIILPPVYRNLGNALASADGLSATKKQVRSTRRLRAMCFVVPATLLVYLVFIAVTRKDFVLHFFTS